jgi:membrane protease YdiL (CAAX protease family)
MALNVASCSVHAQPRATPGWQVRATTENLAAKDLAPTTGHGLIGVVANHPVASFFALTYLFSWGYWIPIALDRYGWLQVPWHSHVPGALGPMLAAFVTTALTTGRPGLADLLARMGRWRVGRSRFLVAACSLWAFFAVAAMALAIRGQGWPELADLAPSGLLLMVLGQLLVVPFGEETGWRGFALPQLQRTRSPLEATLVLAVFGALWHVPLFFFAESFRGLSVAYLPGFFLGMTAGYVVLTWIYNRTAGSILMAALWHGALNLTTGSDAAEGTIQAVVTTAIMVWGITLVVAELRAHRQGHHGPLQPQPDQPKTLTQQGFVKYRG